VTPASTTGSEEVPTPAFARLVRESLQAPAAAIADLLETITSDARRGALERALPDLERMRAASGSLNAMIRELAGDRASDRRGEPSAQFDRRMRHELRTPLTAIKGYSELLIEDQDAAGDDRLRDGLAKLKELAEQLIVRLDAAAGPPPADGGDARLVSDLLQTLRPREITDAGVAPSQSARILVVDDNADNRDLLARQLDRDGHEIVHAASGPQALELVATQELDLVLLDIMMPEMNGFEVLRRLKASEAGSRVPVIVISARGDLDGVVRSIEAGAEDYLTKPFNRTLLRARIGACLEKKRLRDRERQLVADLEEALRQDIAKRRLVEAALHASETQRFLIETERLASLGGLVAGVAHEISGPVGASLTVASTLANRSARFVDEIAAGPVRRALLVEFADRAREAADLLVGNLQRTGELVHSFKQVAVDRSQAERRTFDLRPATEQIVASLRSGLRKGPTSIGIAVPSDIIMNSYPGAYGQILTNLVFNAVTHGFDDGADGQMMIKARRLGMEEVEVTFSDDGKGMAEDVQRRAFDPFFTTRRAHGNTGLGLHIVYNIVTQQLGGRIALVSAPGQGTTFRMTLPRLAPDRGLARA
jgi:signal transduction histidine kinase